jgi:hypothetical protein
LVPNGYAGTTTLPVRRVSWPCVTAVRTGSVHWKLFRWEHEYPFKHPEHEGDDLVQSAESERTLVSFSARETLGAAPCGIMNTGIHKGNGFDPLPNAEMWQTIVDFVFDEDSWALATVWVIARAR